MSTRKAHLEEVEEVEFGEEGAEVAHVNCPVDFVRPHLSRGGGGGREVEVEGGREVQGKRGCIWDKVADRVLETRNYQTK